MAKIGARETERVRAKLHAPDAKGRAAELAHFLQERGVDADVVETPSGSVELREHNCPYAKTVGEHPEVCSIIHTVLHETVSPAATQIESLATGGSACRFDIGVGSQAAHTTGGVR